MKSMDGNIDYSNQIGMTEDGYMMIQQGMGIARKEKSIAKYDGRRKHKKKVKEKTDFYKFQMKNINDRRAVFQEDEVEQINLVSILKRYLVPSDYDVDFQKKTTNEFLIVCASVTLGIISDIWLGVWSANVLGLSLSTDEFGAKFPLAKRRSMKKLRG